MTQLILAVAHRVLGKHIPGLNVFVGREEVSSTSTKCSFKFEN